MINRNMTISQKLAALMTLAYEVNRDTEYAVFCTFSGHVNLIELRVNENKIDSYQKHIFQQRCYLNEPEMNDIEQMFSECTDYLNGLMRKEGETNL